MFDKEVCGLIFCLGRLVGLGLIFFVAVCVGWSPSLSRLLDGEGGLLPTKTASSSPSVDGLKVSSSYVKNCDVCYTK